jgi:hypothetical protein
MAHYKVLLLTEKDTLLGHETSPRIWQGSASQSVLETVGEPTPSKLMLIKLTSDEISSRLVTDTKTSLRHPYQPANTRTRGEPLPRGQAGRQGLRFAPPLVPAPKFKTSDVQ